MMSLAPLRPHRASPPIKRVLRPRRAKPAAMSALAAAAMSLALGLGGCAPSTVPSQMDSGPAAGYPSTASVEAALPAVEPEAPAAAPGAQQPAVVVVDPQHLLRGQAAASPSGAARYEMQSDGNLVVYLGDEAAWASGTVGANSMSMQDDGNLVVADAATGEVRWSSGTGDQGPSTVAVGDDGVLSVRTAAGTATWDSVSGDLVHPKPPAAPAAPSAPRPAAAQPTQEDSAEPEAEQPEQQKQVDPAGYSFAGRVAAAVAALPGGGHGAVFYPYGHPTESAWGVTNLGTCEAWISPSTPSNRILDVVRHEYGHVLQCRVFGGDTTELEARIGMSGIERTADAVALRLGASWVNYTASPADWEWAAADALLAGLRI